jgi:hypothetical protein
MAFRMSTDNSADHGASKLDARHKSSRLSHSLRILLLTLLLLSAPAYAQETRGTSPLSIAKGGTGGATAATAFANIVQPSGASTLGGVVAASPQRSATASPQAPQ